YPSHGRGICDTSCSRISKGFVSVTSISTPYEYQKLVFVLDVGLVEHPNAFPVSSGVRLDMRDYVHYLCPGSLNFAAKKRFEILGNVGNRKPASACDRLLSRISSNQVTRELIKRRAQIMQYFTHDHGESKRNIAVESKSLGPLAGLWIVLSND